MDLRDFASDPVHGLRDLCGPLLLAVWFVLDPCRMAVCDGLNSILVMRLWIDGCVPRLIGTWLCWDGLIAYGRLRFGRAACFALVWGSVPMCVLSVGFVFDWLLEKKRVCVLMFVGLMWSMREITLFCRFMWLCLDRFWKWVLDEFVVDDWW